MESVTEVQIQTVQSHLSSVLSPDNTTRKQHEAELTQLRNMYPSHLTTCLIHTLRHSQEEMVKTLSAVILRQMFSNLVPQNTQAWNSFSEDFKSAVKSELLNAIRAETSYVVSKRISEAIAELSVMLLAGDKPESWEELFPFLLEAVGSQDNRLIAVGFHVLSGLSTFFHEEMMKQKESLYNIFIANLQNQDSEVRLRCIDAACNLLGIVDTPESMYFGETLNPMLTSVVWLLEKSVANAEEAIKSLRDLAETEPKFFQSRLNVVYEFLEHIMKLDSDHLGVKYLALDFQVTIAERLSTDFQENHNLCNAVCSKIFEMMISIEQEVYETWLKPEEGFQEEDREDSEIEIDYAKLGRKLLTRMLEGIGDFLIGQILELVKNALQNADWRMHYASLMTLSEAAQFISETEKIGEIVPIVQSHLSPESNPKVRYAAYVLVARLSEDFEEEFQANHHEAIVPLLLQGASDPVPRVAASACEAINKFFENAGQTIATKYVSQVIQKLIEKLGSENISLVIESSLEALSSLAEACKVEFASFYKQLIPFLVNIIKSYKGDVYKKMKGRAIECLTLMCSSVGKEVFSQNANEVINLLIEIQNTELTQNDPLRAYIMSAWQRICATLGSDFSYFLEQIVPGLLQGVSTEASVSIASEPGTFVDIQSLMTEDSKKKISVTTADLEEKDVAMNTLLTIIDVVKGGFAPYVQQTSAIITPLLDYTVNESVRSTAASICGSLVVSVKESGDPSAQSTAIEMSKGFLGRLWEVTAKEFDTDALVNQLEAIKTLIETPGIEFLAPEEVNSSGEKLIKILESSLQRRERNEKIAAEDSEEEDEFITELNKKEEDSLHTAISEVLGALFKTHKVHSLTIIDFFYNNILSRFLAPEASNEDHKFAIFVIDDVIEFVGQDLAQDKWNALAEALVKYAADTDDAVRQAAVYGIGILAAHSKNETFGPWVSQIIQVLESAISIPVTKSKKSHGHARDNAIAALGRIIKFQYPNINPPTVVPAWVNLLPLRFDKVEARTMHDILLDLALSNLQLVIGDNQERLGHLMKMFAEILETKMLDSGSVPKVKSLFETVQAAGYPGLQEIWATFTDIQKEKVSKVLGQ